MNATRKKARAQFITATRKKLQFQQTEFAGFLGVHPITVSKWERGLAQPSPWQIAIIEALSTSPRDRDLVECFCKRGIAAALALGLEHLHR